MHWIFSKPKSDKNGAIALFRYKMFMLDEMTQLNTSKFAIFYIYKDPKLLFQFLTTYMLVYFFPNECPGLCQYRSGDSLVKKL